MKTTFLSVLVLVGAILTVMTRRPAMADSEVSFEYFYDALAPYGQWLDVEGYGYCWTPDNVDADWTPYSEGNWIYTDAGWTWVGDEEFSGIVDHYGRWIMVDDVGWCWVPGYDWAPAWVSWRDTEDYIGWAPLPPEAVWQPSIGFGVWVDDYYGIGPRYYSFCHRRDFGEHHLRRYLVPRSRNMILINESVNITNISYNNAHGDIFCGGPSFERVNRFANHQVVSLKLDRREDFDFRDGDRHQRPLPRGIVSGGSFQIIAPRIAASVGRSIHPQTNKIVTRDHVHKGWTGIGDAAERESVRNKIHLETRGLTPKNAPAKTMAGSEPQAIPGRGLQQDNSSKTITADSLRRNVPDPNTRRAIVPNELNQPPKAIPMPQIQTDDNPPAGRNNTIIGGSQRNEQMERQNFERQKMERANAENLNRQREAEALARRQILEKQNQQELMKRHNEENARINAEKLSRQRESEESSKRNMQRQQEMERQRSNAQPKPQPQPQKQEERGRERRKGDDDDKKKKN